MTAKAWNYGHLASVQSSALNYSQISIADARSNSTQSQPAVLILNTAEPTNKAILTDTASGSVINVTFAFGNGTEAYRSCSITWHNEMYVFGGSNYSRQISMIKKCALERIGQLNFEHYSAACSSSDNHVYLCFNGHSHSDGTKCRVADNPLGNFIDMPESSFDHRWTRIASNSEYILAVGGYTSHTVYNRKSELFSIRDNKWQTANDYPFGMTETYLVYAPMINIGDKFYVFGGDNSEKSSGIIAMFDTKMMEWKNVSSMETPRQGHNVITDGHKIIVAGGWGQNGFNTEICSYGMNSVVCKSQQPQLTMYTFYPELFLVPHTFCQN